MNWQAWPHRFGSLLRDKPQSVHRPRAGPSVMMGSTKAGVPDGGKTVTVAAFGFNGMARLYLLVGGQFCFSQRFKRDASLLTRYFV
jgi:hypothetical protein